MPEIFKTLKLFKWESINFIRKYYLFYLAFGVCLLLARFFPIDHNYSSTIATICSFVGGFLFGLSTVFLVEITFSWLNKKTALLESSIPIESWKILLTKIVFLILTQAINCILVWMLSIALKRFWTDNISYLNITFYTPIKALILYLTLVTTVSFSDFLARSMEKKYHTILAVMLFILIMIALLYSTAIYLKITGSADVTFYGLSFSVKNEQSQLARYIFYSFVTIIFFIANCKLLEKKIDI